MTETIIRFESEEYNKEKIPPQPFEHASFSKHEQNLIITNTLTEKTTIIPLTQKSYDAIGEFSHDTDNLIGIIAGDEFSISQLIDLGYKGTQQEGMPIIGFTSKEDLETICKEFNIQIWEHELCVKCKEAIRSSCSWDNGPVCYKCNKN